MIRLETGRLVLRPVVGSDEKRWIDFYEENHGFLAPWSPTVATDVSASQRFTAYLRTTSRAWSQHRSASFAAFEGENLIGFFSLNEISRGVFQSAHAGWLLGERHTGQGLALEALTGLFDHAFSPKPDGMALHRVQANILAANLPSIALAERLGMRHEGVAKQMLRINGQWQDHLVFAILSSEFGTPD